jgi:triacylglycerol lipase
MRIFASALPRLAGMLALVVVSACSADSIMGPSMSADYAKGGHKPPPPPPPPAPTHDPILFVHGLNASSSTWTTMVSRFTQDGWTSAELVNWSYDYTRSNATTASLIAKKVDSILKATGAAKVDIITHSMGAMSARYYVRNLGGDGKVDALVTLGGANHGTTTASLCAFFWVSCAEMIPGSTFLNTLNSVDETWGSPRYGAWWSPCDDVINPLASAQLLDASVETACLQHSDLHEDPTVYGQVRDFVTGGPLPLPVLAVAP